MMVGAVLQATAYTRAHLMVARIVAGFFGGCSKIPKDLRTHPKDGGHFPAAYSDELRIRPAQRILGTRTIPGEAKRSAA